VRELKSKKDDINALKKEKEKEKKNYKTEKTLIQQISDEIRELEMGIDKL